MVYEYFARIFVRINIAVYTTISTDLTSGSSSLLITFLVVLSIVHNRKTQNLLNKNCYISNN